MSETTFSDPDCDILHTFAAGLIKNCILWVIIIVSSLKKYPEFAFSEGLLDARIASFKDLPKMKNMMNSYFRKGICYITSSKSGKDQEKSTGGAGGYRSSEFVSLLVQMYFAIGVKGDIVPNTPHFNISVTIQVGNMTKIILTAISKVLDCFFALRTSPLTEERIDIIQNKMTNMQGHFILLHQLKQYCIGKQNPGLPMSRKFHAACCNVAPFMRIFGPMEKADTAAYESVHRFMTVALWHMTSKRYHSMNEEMANQSLLLSYATINEFIHAVTSNTMNDYIDRRGTSVHPDVVEHKSISNMKSYPMTVDEVTNCFCGNTDFINLLKSGGVNKVHLSLAVQQKFGQRAWATIRPPITDRSNRLEIIQALSIHGNEESGLGKIIIYCTLINSIMNGLDMTAS
jgi:hypothetical protein